MSPFTEAQHATLRAVCDTVVPAVDRADDPHGFWARKATDVATDAALVEALAAAPLEQQAGLAELLDALALQGFEGLSQPSREQVLMNLCLASRDAAAGVGALVSMTLFFFYGLPPNPAWPVLGYPGPISAPPDVPKPIVPVQPADGATLETDVVVVGSGAGGGVVAARLAQAGLKVLVLEAGGYFNEADFNQSELWAFQNLYWRGGPVPTGDLNVTLLAGAGLGGGTTINWTNCLPTKPWVRQEWAAEHGLEDIGTEAFDRHLDAVWQRLKVNDRCSELNGTQESFRRGAEALGWSFRTVNRNWDPDRHDPAMAGYMGFGDQSGAKQGTLKTYLQDAVDAGAEVVVGCFAERVLVEGGRAAGVAAVVTTPAGGQARITVRAGQVVVAAGALESPALLLRSGLGGPAAGEYLRLHPCNVVMADYGVDQKAWWGAPHAGLVDEFAAGSDGDPYGFLIEATQYTTGLAATATPWTSGREHKALIAESKNYASSIGLVRDHGHGRVVLGPDGQGVAMYGLDDPRDVATSRRAIEAQIRMHHAAGARRILLGARSMPTWRVGDDLEAFIARCRRVPLRAGGAMLFSAHQMGSCRMGADPRTSVADPRGELHDTPGVWIGDGSAFPTPSGTNPMITIMALAHRTAEHVAAAAGTSLTTTQEVPA